MLSILWLEPTGLLGCVALLKDFSFLLHCARNHTVSCWHIQYKWYFQQQQQKKSICCSKLASVRHLGVEAEHWLICAFARGIERRPSGQLKPKYKEGSWIGKGNRCPLPPNCPVTTLCVLTVALAGLLKHQQRDNVVQALNKRFIPLTENTTPGPSDNWA